MASKPDQLLQPSEGARIKCQNTNKSVFTPNGLCIYHIFLLIFITFVTCIPEEEGQGHYDQGSHYGQQDNQTTVKFHLAPAKFFNHIE